MSWCGPLVLCGRAGIRAFASIFRCGLFLRISFSAASATILTLCAFSTLLSLHNGHLLKENHAKFKKVTETRRKVLFIIGCSENLQIRAGVSLAIEMRVIFNAFSAYVTSRSAARTSHLVASFILEELTRTLITLSHQSFGHFFLEISPSFFPFGHLVATEGHVIKLLTKPEEKIYKEENEPRKLEKPYLYIFISSFLPLYHTFILH